MKLLKCLLSASLGSLWFACSHSAHLDLSIEKMTLQPTQVGEWIEGSKQVEWSNSENFILEVSIECRAIDSFTSGIMQGVMFVEGRKSGILVASWDRLIPGRFRFSFEIANDKDPSEATSLGLDYSDGTLLWVVVQYLEKDRSTGEWAELAESSRVDVTRYRADIEQHLRERRVR